MKHIAYLVEWSDDRACWQDGSIHWYLEGAVKSAEQIPYSWRIRKVELSIGELVLKEDIKEAQKQIQIWDKILKNLEK